MCGSRDVVVPIVSNNGWPIVDTTVRKQSVRLLVDTGAGASVISALLLGVPDGSTVVLDRLCVGALCVEDAVVWATDNALVQPVADEKHVQGLVGAPLLRHAVLELNRGETLGLHFERGACKGRATALTFDEFERPFAEVSFDGVSFGSVLVDTGAAYTMLSEQSAEKVADYVRDGAATATSCSILGCNDMAQLGRLHEVCAGDLCENEVETKFPVWDAVGSSFFARARYAVDGPRGRLLRCDDE